MIDPKRLMVLKILNLEDRHFETENRISVRVLKIGFS